MRRLFKLLLLGLLLLALAAVSVPLWLGGALSATQGWTGLSFAQYERVGYSRFALTGARLERGRTTVTVDRVEAPTPLRWLWHRSTLPEGESIVASAWSVEVAPPVAKAGPGVRSARGWMPTRETVGRILDRLDPWLPAVTTGRGEVRLPSVRLTLESARYASRSLNVHALRYRTLQIDVASSWSAASDELRAELTHSENAWRVEGVSKGSHLQGRLHALGQVAEGEATFDTTGWLPLEATAQANAWRAAGTEIGWGHLYEQVSGDLSAEWREGRLQFNASANGEPNAEAGPVPPLNVQLRGAGDRNEVVVEELVVQMPGVTASLSAPLRVRREQWSALSPSRFDLAADLSELPWLELQGILSGFVVVSPREGAAPTLAFEASATGFTMDEWTFPAASVVGNFDWPAITFQQVSLTSAETSRVVASGRWDFRERTLTDGVVEAEGDAASLKSVLPAALTFGTAQVKASVAGPWPELAHSGQVTWTALQFAPMKAVDGHMVWSGNGSSLAQASVELTAGASRVELSGSAERQSARLQTLTWRGPDERTLSLSAPVEIAWPSYLQINPLVLSDATTALELSGRFAEHGSIQAKVAHFGSSWLRDWIDLPDGDWQVKALSVAGQWPKQALDFQVKAEVEAVLRADRSALVTLAARGNADGVIIETFALSEDGKPALSAEGRLPVVIQPWSAERLRFDDAGELALSATSAPHALIWNDLAAWTGVRIVTPALSANVGGTWSKPRGELRLSAGQVALEGERWPSGLPALDQIRVRATGEGNEVVLEELSLLVAQQTVRGRGRLLVGEEGWNEARKNPWNVLRERASFRIEIPDAQIAELARFAPAYLAPSGTLRADVTLEPGGELKGFVALQGAASRPLGPLGVLQEVNADLQFSGRTLRFNQVAARMGGQPLALKGDVALPAKGPVRIDVSLTGENLPFIRQTGLLLRGDLDLRIRTDDAGETRISGRTRLRDSLFLADLLALLPGRGGAAGPERRPPYFAITMEPLNAWGLDVEIEGVRFLRLRTPVFTGEASAKFRLGGTLGAPRAVGEATIDEGNVLLPFASFRVNQGRVRLTEADPYQPMLAVTGSGRRFGYDLRMELTGPATEPTLRFTSSPPLSSEQVLLLVMAGQPPTEEFAYTGRQRVVRLGTYLGQSLLRGLGGESSSAERFSLTVGERISRQGRETYGFTYELDPRWSLVGEYDEFDDYNVGVKWRLFSEAEEKNDEP